MFLGVRTVGSTKILRLQLRGGTSQNPLVQSVATFSRTEMGGRHVVDLTAPVTSGTKHVYVLAVNDAGHVYRCSSDVHQPPYVLNYVDRDLNLIRYRQCVYSIVVEEPDDHFQRIAATAREETLLLLSAKTMRMIDFRVRRDIHPDPPTH